MSALLPWALEALIATTLLMALVMALRGPVRRLFGAQVAYALWLLPALRMVLPPLPQTWSEAAATPITRAGETITLIVIPGQAATAGKVADPSGPSLAIAALVVWAGIALAFLGFQMWRHRRFCRAVLEGGHTIDHAGSVAIVESSAAPGPIAFGVMQRYVAFPRDFAERYDEDERALALAHELGHHQRGDLAANWLALVILALHWFNPLAWIAHKAFRADQELANDARVLAGRSLYDRHAYACAIVKAAHGGAFSAACHLHSIKDLKGRLKMLRTQTSKRRIAAGGVGIAAVTLAALGITASGTRAAETMRATVSDATGVPLPVAHAPEEPGEARSVERVHEDDGVHRTRVVIVRNGKTTTLEGSAAEAYLAAAPAPVPPAPPAPPADYAEAVPPVPPTPYTPYDAPLPPAAPVAPTAPVVMDVGAAVAMGMRQAQMALRAAPIVASGRCGIVENGPATIHASVNGRERITICTDRIEAQARRGAQMAAQSARMQRVAMRQALDGLRAAQTAMARDMKLHGEAREEALRSMQDSIAEMEQDMRED
jgi:bla regulator protein BlaR1